MRFVNLSLACQPSFYLFNRDEMHKLLDWWNKRDLWASIQLCHVCVCESETRLFFFKVYTRNKGSFNIRHKPHYSFYPPFLPPSFRSWRCRSLNCCGTTRAFVSRRHRQPLLTAPYMSASVSSFCWLLQSVLLLGAVVSTSTCSFCLTLSRSHACQMF